MWKTSSSRTRANTARVSGSPVEHLRVEREASGRRLLGQVKEREQRLVALLVDAQVVEAALARRQPVGLEARAAGRGREQLAAPPAKELGVALLVLGVAQEEPAQERVARELGGAGEVARRRPPRSRRKRRSLRARRCASFQTRRCSGLSSRSNVDGAARTASDVSTRRATLPPCLPGSSACRCSRAGAALLGVRRRGERSLVRPPRGAARALPAPAVVDASGASRRRRGDGARALRLCRRGPAAGDARCASLASGCRSCWPWARRSWLAARPPSRAPVPETRIEARLAAPDPRTGWAFVPGRTVDLRGPDGRVIRYAIDAHGDRAPSADWVEDPRAPTVVDRGRVDRHGSRTALERDVRGTPGRPPAPAGGRRGRGRVRQRPGAPARRRRARTARPPRRGRDHGDAGAALPQPARRSPAPGAARRAS